MRILYFILAAKAQYRTLAPERLGGEIRTLHLCINQYTVVNIKIGRKIERKWLIRGGGVVCNIQSAVVTTNFYNAFL